MLQKTSKVYNGGCTDLREDELHVFLGTVARAVVAADLDAVPVLVDFELGSGDLRDFLLGLSSLLFRGEGDGRGA